MEWGPVSKKTTIAFYYTMVSNSVKEHSHTTTATTDTTSTAACLDKQEINDNDQYLVKTIIWKDKPIQIITQNENGPCPLVAICNVLFLRGDLEIRPPGREMVTFEYLVDRIANFLLEQDPFTVSSRRGKPAQSNDDDNPANKAALVVDTPTSNASQQEFLLTYRHNLDDVLSILPKLKTGLDVNIQFNNSIRGFEPSVELAMFDLFHVDLVHGWLVDPDIQDRETYDLVVNQCKTYNNLVEFIVESTATGSTVTTGDGVKNEEEKLHKGFLAREFLSETATQLTYYGLSLLVDSIPENSLCVLFRNNHFSTLYRHPTLGLCMLVTDSGLVKERSVVWESLSDIDQGSSEFFDGYFRKSTDAPPDVQQEDKDLSYAIALSLEQEQEQQARRLTDLQLQSGQQQQQQQNYEGREKDRMTTNSRNDKRKSTIITDEKANRRKSQALSIKSAASGTNNKSTNKAKGKCTIM